MIDLERVYLREELEYINCPIHNHKPIVKWGYDTFSTRNIISYKECSDRIYIMYDKIQDINIFGDNDFIFERDRKSIFIGVSQYYFPISYFSSFLKYAKSNRIDNWLDMINLLK